MAHDWNQQELERVRAHAADGWSASMIGREIGVTKNAIIGVCGRNKIKLHGSKPPSSQGPKIGRPRKKVTSRPRQQQAIPFRKHAYREEVEMPIGDPVKYEDLEPLGKNRRNQCRRFLNGQSGIEGMVCATPTPVGESWCLACRRLLFVPIVRTMRKAA